MICVGQNGVPCTINPPDVQLMQQIYVFIGILATISEYVLVGIIASIITGGFYNSYKVARGKDLKSPKIGADAERGILLALIVALVYYSLFGSSYDFGVIQGNPLAYGWLWYLFNPIHNDRFIWGITTLAVYFTMLKIQFAQVRKGRIAKWLVYLNLGGVLFSQMIGVTRDISVIMFAPLVSWNPLFLIPMVLQKFGFNRTMWEQLNFGKIGLPFGNPVLGGTPGIFEVQYVILLFWFVFPPIVWLVKRLKRRRNLGNPGSIDWDSPEIQAELERQDP